MRRTNLFLLLAALFTLGRTEASAQSVSQQSKEDSAFSGKLIVQPDRPNTAHEARLAKRRIRRDARRREKLHFLQHLPE